MKRYEMVAPLQRQLSAILLFIVLNGKET